ncbi:hypothetical protein [Caballeronia sp. Lep1P3]|uniref:hypothetical protein n=1 Tax=Caballeronia sp. Lep1P3 TaxID=2878150 RepID=UPI001FD0F225|nr:hypothetical protein [Caballeronia sp. Lep1P3]
MQASVFDLISSLRHCREELEPGSHNVDRDRILELCDVAEPFCRLDLARQTDLAVARSLAVLRRPFLALARLEAMLCNVACSESAVARPSESTADGTF